ncbi:MAG: SDR family oxidoreductase [Bacteroidales bacterium]|nr:SDR family oxidoreductase [Bacteroidales bacterium]
MNFKDKIVWITGASSGIGKALAIEFAKAGSTLILSSRNSKKLEAIKVDCEALGATCLIQILDLENQENFVEFAKKISTKFKKIDILINNGGISQRSLVNETPLSIDRKIMEINFFGNIALTKAVLPYMIEQQSGSIVTISSVTGKFGVPKRSTYSASKHALQGFYESLRAEHKKDNINVNIVIPGYVKTNISFNAVLSDGSTNNKLDDGQAGGVTAEKCAQQIVKGIKKNKKEILIGGKELVMVHLRRFLPSVYYNIIDKVQTT